MELANKWVQPTRYSGDYPNWAGYTFLDFHKSNNVYHPGDDYNWGVAGDDDLGQDVKACTYGVCIHTSKATTGYGNIIVLKHQLGYNLKRFVKETYGIETDFLYSFYAHLKDILIAVGNEVNADSLIAHVGNSGTQYAHLHFEIYAPIGDLVNRVWRFYPIGWSKEQIQKYWLPSYKFIEATKQIDSFETFLGKPKEYWLQVEKDRESLLQQLSDKDKEWVGKLQAIETENGTLREESAKKDTTIEELNKTIKSQSDDFNQKLIVKDNEISKLKTRITEILKDNSENYKFWEAIRLVWETIKNKIRG
jgi:uncharacterized protein YeeX (DUF496 family)